VLCGLRQQQHDDVRPFYFFYTVTTLLTAARWREVMIAWYTILSALQHFEARTNENLIEIILDDEVEAI
jgi:hypothetical protein